MPVNLARLSANRATAAIDFGEAGTLHVDYYPARITLEMLLNNAAVQDPSSLKDLSVERAATLIHSPVEMLPVLLAHWDLTETTDDGSEQSIPLDAAHIAALGIQVQWAIFRGLLNDQQSSATGEASASEASASAPSSDATSPATAP